MTKPTLPEGCPVASDPHFTLMADSEGVGYVHCGDGVLVVPLTADGQVLLAVEHSPAFGREILTWSRSVDEGESARRRRPTASCKRSWWRAERIRVPGRASTPSSTSTRARFLFLGQELVPGRQPRRRAASVRGAEEVPLDRWWELWKQSELAGRPPPSAALSLAERHLAGLGDGSAGGERPGAVKLHRHV